jgi:adenosylcobinamide kinase/adenosylcobinamide-phosphate guanylyltransferase
VIALVTGGSGCGKSTWAEKRVARLDGRKVYIATMRVVDDECAARVRRHRAQRAGLGFETVERPRDIGAAPVAPAPRRCLSACPRCWQARCSAATRRGCCRHRAPDEDLPSPRHRYQRRVLDGLAYDPDTVRYQTRPRGDQPRVAGRADLVAEVVFSIRVALKGVLA